VTLEEMVAAPEGLGALLQGDLTVSGGPSALIRGLLDSFPDPIFIKDTGSRFRYVNPAQARVLGVDDPADAVGKTDSSFFSEEHAKAFQADDLAVFRSGVPIVDKTEWLPRGMDAWGQWVATTRAPVFGADGSVVGLGGVTRLPPEQTPDAEALARRVRALTGPDADLSDLGLTDLLDLDALQELQQAFADASGVAVLLTLPDGTPVTRPSGLTRLCGEIVRKTEKGFAHCVESDAKLGEPSPDGPIVQRCKSVGLWGAGASIYIGDRHIGNWLIGQALDETFDLDPLIAYAREIGADEEEFRKALDEVPRMSRERFAKVAHALHTIAGYVSLLALRNVQQARDIAERAALEEERRAHLRALQSLERVDAALRGSPDLDSVAGNVMDVLLDILEVDRAWLTHPCDPDAPYCRIEAERTRPGFAQSPGAGSDVEITEGIRAIHQRALSENGPIADHPDEPEGFAPELRAAHGIQSALMMALHPKVGRPWLFGVHQCAHARVWSEDDRWLLQEAGRRLTDALSALLLFRDVRSSEEHLRLVLDATSDGVWDWDLTTGDVWWSPRLCEFFAADPQDSMRHIDHIRGLYHPDHLEKTFALVEEHLAGRTERFESDTLMRGYDGEYRWVRLRAGGVDPGPDGRARRMVGTLTDIAEKVRAEEERRKLEEQIQETQKLESLGILAGGIAHDFNNLLMGVLGNASLALAELPVESPARECVEHVETAALRAAELAKQMLAYSGKGRFVVQSLDLSALVEEMRRLLASSISKKATLTCDLERNLPPVEGDATQLRQIVMNLITNASDALEDEAGIIAVRTGSMEAPDGYDAKSYIHDSLPPGRCVFVEVADTGCGMDESTRRRIFDPFFTTKVGGRGLGMAAVLGIVRGHRGALSVYSEPGKGTRIRVVFPCVSGAPAAAIEPSEAAPHADAEWRGFGIVLIVDDEQSVRQVAAMTLERRGFTVLQAEDGQAGVDLFREHKDGIVAVVLDMTLPRMSGQEAFERIRAIRPDVPVLLSSGFNEQDAVGRAVGLGLAGFIQKPYRPSELIARLRGVLLGNDPSE